MATSEKYDILNYEEGLTGMVARGIYYPRRSPWEMDGELLVADLWDKSPKTDGEKAQLLIDEVFMYPRELAAFCGVSLPHLYRLRTSPKMNALEDWDERHDGPADRLWKAYCVYTTCGVLTSPEFMNPHRARLLCRPTEYASLLAELTRLRFDSSRYLGGSPNTLTMLGTMLALSVSDYSCWTDQWRWPAE